MDDRGDRSKRLDLGGLFELIPGQPIGRNHRGEHWSGILRLVTDLQSYWGRRSFGRHDGSRQWFQLVAGQHMGCYTTAAPAKLLDNTLHFGYVLHVRLSHQLFSISKMAPARTQQMGPTGQ